MGELKGMKEPVRPQLVVLVLHQVESPLCGLSGVEKT
jgi:hypothetical protein